MYSASEIRSAARRTSQGESDLRRTEQQITSYIQETSSWWKGKAGSRFKDGYNDSTRPEMTSMYAEIRAIESALTRLAREVEIADEQRRAEAARKALEEKRQQKNKR